MQHRIGVIVGSLRQGAYSRMLARALPELVPQSLQLTDIGIGELPLYNQDLETDSPPPAWTAFRKALQGCDAILFVTPEYNRSMPGAVKNALDVGSRPWGKSSWMKGQAAMPAGVISITPGALGAMASNHHLRQVLLAVNLAAMPYPEAYIPAAASLFDDSGKLSNADTRQFLTTFLQSFESWVSRLRQS
jgi:chromate reductase, NAD(P)H dehydrogenase (quinone)